MPSHGKRFGYSMQSLQEAMDSLGTAMRASSKSMAELLTIQQRRVEEMNKKYQGTIDQGVDMPLEGEGFYNKFRLGSNFYEKNRSFYEPQKFTSSPVWTTSEFASVPPQQFTFVGVDPPAIELTPMEWLTQQVDEVCALAHAA